MHSLGILLWQAEMADALCCAALPNPKVLHYQILTVYRDLRYTVKVEDTSNEAKAKAAQAGVLSKLRGKNSKLVSKDVLKGLSGVIHPGR